jgi:hypothetical protein
VRNEALERGDDDGGHDNHRRGGVGGGELPVGAEALEKGRWIMTTATAASVNGAAAKKGFGCLPCIRCGQEATVRLDLDDCATFTCGECEESWTADELREHLAKWQRVLAWVDAAATFQE